MATLPQWKVQLLERKRRDEEEGRRRENAELERLARMPAWKREIIERRRARLSSGSSLSEAPGEGLAPGGGAGALPAGLNGADGVERLPGDAQGAVLRENICPVYQNHFIQQEKQRRETLEPEQPPWPRQAAEPLDHVPGVRTIRADNITVVECDPVCLEGRGKAPPCLGPEQAGPIPAAGQLNVKSSLSRSVEDLNSLERGREDYAEQEEQEERGRVSRLLSRFDQGRDFAGRPRPARSHSTDNIIGRASPARHHRRHRQPLPRSPSPPPARTVAAFRSRFEARWAAEGAESPCRAPEARQPEAEGLAEAAGAATRPLGAPASEPGRAGLREGLAVAPASSAGHCDADERRPSPDPSQQGPSPDHEAKPPSAPDPHPATEAQARALAELRARSKKSFVVVPRPRRGAPPESEPEDEAGGSSRSGNSAGSLVKPQLVSMASSSCAEWASDSLAVAAASAAAASCPAAPNQRDADNGPRDGQTELGPESPVLSQLGQEPAAVGQEAQEEPGMSRLYHVKLPSSAGPPRTPATGPEEVRLTAYSSRAAGGPFSRSEGAAAPVPHSASGSGEPLAERGAPGADGREGPGQKGFWARAQPREDRPAGSGSPPTPTGRAGRVGTPQRKSGKTITINPRKMAGGKPVPASGATAENGVGPPAGTPPTAVPGAPVKKRYPTAEEIRVIGGYVHLQRSCLAKAGPRRRKVNISFNDCELESTFEYPSELALLAEFGTVEEEPLPARELDEEEEEEEVLVPRLGVPGSPLVGKAIRRKPLLVDESCR
uniref:phostensin-like n=1 Tax=Pristiophorus japonicus TaxID=55135 RepID=UPI00398E7197